MENIISVVIPSYSQGRFLAENIVSVLSQQGNFYIDCIVVDGDSRDSSKEVIRNFEDLLKQDGNVSCIRGLPFYSNSGRRDSQVQCLGISYRWISEEDNGHYDALNKGFALSMGNIMTWLNSDDKYHPGCLQCVSDVFDSFGDVNWLTGMTTLWDINGKILHQKHEYKNVYDFFFGRYSWIQQESTFWRRSLWEKSGAFITRNLKFMVDGELWCRFFSLDRLYHVDMPLGGYRLHDTNRAHGNSRAVDEEMHAVINDLRRNVGADIVRTYKHLRRIRLALRVLPLENVFRTICSRTYAEASYDEIVSVDGYWKKVKRPFRLIDENACCQPKRCIRRIIKPHRKVFRTQETI
jgi:glycosyltransferase involved in cell wall biosynthesis